MVRQKCEGGIYRITLVTTGKTYIGRTKRRFEIRWQQHKNNLNRNAHVNAHLQSAWNKYGSENFEFAILEPIRNIEELVEAESRWMCFYDAINLGFNLHKDGLGCLSHSPDVIKKLKAKAKEPGVREKYIASLAKIRQDPVIRERRLQALRESCSTPESLKKRSESIKRYYSNPANREQRSQMMKARIRSEEGRNQWAVLQASHERMRRRHLYAPPANRSLVTQNRNIDRRGYDYELVDPSGNKYFVVDIRGFCKEHGLAYDTVKTFSRIGKGSKMRSGWFARRVYRDPIVRDFFHYSLTDPSGNIFEVDNLEEFCKERGLNYQKLFRRARCNFEVKGDWNIKRFDRSAQKG